MFYFLLRLFVYTLAAAIVMNVTPGLRLAPYPRFGEPLTTVLAYVGIGVIFAILHDFVRPVILVLAGRLYIWSLGSLALAVDILNFLLISYLAPTEWEISGWRFFSAVLGAVLMGVVVMALEALFGFDSPRMIEVRKTPLYWRWLAMLPGGRRNRLVESLRTRQMIAIIQSYGIDILVGLSPLRGFRQAMQKRIYRVRPRLIENDPAVKVRLMLQALGPSFVKFGQLVASRAELLPNAWRLELAKLQDEVKPFPYSEVEQVIRRELGAVPEEVFAEFEPQPLAAASTAQVHAATLKSGESVIVKVLRPNIEVIVRGDLNVMQELVNTLERRLRWLRKFGLGALFNEFAENVLTELDLSNEAYHARLLRHNMRRFPFVQVPATYAAYSTSKVVTQERVSGLKITDVAALEAAGIDRETLALEFFRAVLQQLLFDGFFHGDLHPGNVWVDPRTKKIIFIDLGMMGRLRPADRIALGQLIWALQERDATLVTRVLLGICEPAKPYDAVLERDVERLIDRHLLLSESPSISVIVTELIGLLTRHGLRPRRAFTLAFKTLGQGEAVMHVLMGDKPLATILEIVYQTMKELLLAQLEPQNLGKLIVKPLAHEVVGRLPALLAAGGALLDDFERGQTVFHLGPDELERKAAKLEASLARGQRRVILSISLVGVLLGSALVLLIPLEGRVSEPLKLIIHVAAGVGLSFSTFFTIVLLAQTLWQTWQGPREDA